MSNLVLITATQFVYTVMLSIIFFSKKKIDKFENKLYSYILIGTLVLLGCGIFTYYTFINYPLDSFVNIFANKFFLICMIFYFVFFYYFI